MRISKKEKQTVEKVLKHWTDSDLIDADKATQLNKSLRTKSFNWQSLAYYSFLFAIVSLLIAVASIFADKALLELIDSLLSTSYLTKSISFLILSMALFWLDHRYNQKSTTRKYSKEIFAILGAILLSISTGLLSFALKIEEKPGLLILLLSVVYFSLAIFKRKELLWIFGIISLIVAFGSFTHNFTEGKGLFLGMNLPLRFSIFGGLILLFALPMKNSSLLKPFYDSTYWSGLLIFFFSLWFLSIFGNYSSYEQWTEISQTHLWWYSIILFSASCAAILIGIKNEDSLMKNIGITFIFLNLYTRYVEYFWDELHKALFFGIIAISFWLIGKKAENIWDTDSNKETN